MVDIEKQTTTAGVYIIYKDYFLFMFGYDSNSNTNELGVVRFGGHREKNETLTECVKREIEEETRLNCQLLDNTITYRFNDKSKNFSKVEYSKKLLLNIPLPILITDRPDKTLSVMYLAYGKGKLRPNMETQGILLLRRQDIDLICSNNITFAEYQKKGGKCILTEKLKKVGENPENFILAPKIQLLFLNQLFKLEPKSMERWLFKRFYRNLH
jgi:hypothetical protein